MVFRYWTALESTVLGLLLSGRSMVRVHSRVPKKCRKPDFPRFSALFIGYCAMFLATKTPLAEAWDKEWVMPLPSPMMYWPG